MMFRGPYHFFKTWLFSLVCLLELRERAQIENYLTIADYSVQKGSTFQLVRRLPGEMFAPPATYKLKSGASV